MDEMIRLADNPLFVKHLRARTRKSGLTSGMVVVAFLAACITGIDLYLRFVNVPEQPDLFPFCFFVLLALQTLLLILIGGSQISNSVAYVKDSGILDYHRITPVPARVQALGFILGAPIREYVLFLTTVPFAFVLAIVSDVGLVGFCKVFLALVGGAVMNHTIAFLVGLSAKTARGASGRYVGFLFGMYLLSNMISGFAMQSKEPYYGPTLISPYAVFYETFAECMLKERQRVMARFQQGGFIPPPPPPQLGKKGNAPPFGGKGNPAAPGPQAQLELPHPKFLGMEIPLVVQSLLAQTAMVGFLFAGASRRMHSSRQPIFSKLQALGFFAVVTFFAAATLWDIPLEGLVVANVYGLTVFGLILLGICTQPSGEMLRGYQRAAKLGHRAPPIWDDLASNFGVVLGIAGCLAAFAVFHYRLMANAQLPVNMPPVESYVYGMGVAIGTVLSAGFLFQFCAARGRGRWTKVTLYLFLLWFAPLILAIAVAIVTDGKDKNEAVYLLAPSPLTSLPMVVMLDRGGAAREMVDTFRIIALGTLALETALFLFLSTNAERKMRAEVQDERDRDELDAGKARRKKRGETEIELDE